MTTLLDIYYFIAATLSDHGMMKTQATLYFGRSVVFAAMYQRNVLWAVRRTGWTMCGRCRTVTDDVRYPNINLRVLACGISDGLADGFADDVTAA